MTRRLLAVLLAVLILLPTISTAQAADVPTDVPVDVPVDVPAGAEPYAGYEPQSTCSPVAKPGTKVLARWVVGTYGGRSGPISRACQGRSVSEHKEGRAFDWMLNASSAADRARAARFLKAAFAPGPTGEPAELARRMGIMYVIWSDHMYAAYRGFAPKAYLSSSCKRIVKCSRTLRHRNHMHISLTRSGGAGQTSWYAGRG